MIGLHILLPKKHLYGKFQESYTFSVGKMPAVRRLNIAIFYQTRNMALLKVKVQLMHLIRLQTSYIATWTRVNN